MKNLHDIFRMAQEDGGKIFVMDEHGEVKLVIMSADDYYRRAVPTQGQAALVDTESVNRAITKAQLQEKEILVPDVVHELPNNLPIVDLANGHHKFQDLREEVIDPSFDFEGPKLNLDDF